MLGIKQPENDTALSFEEAEEIAEWIGYPVLIRPSYVVGGRAMVVVSDRANLRKYTKRTGNFRILLYKINNINAFRFRRGQT